MEMWKIEHILWFKPFILWMDSKCMQFLESMKETRGIYARWMNFMQRFDYNSIHRTGVNNQNAVALSRMEDLLEVPDNHEEEEEWDRQEDLYHAQEAVGLSLLERQRAGQVGDMENGDRLFPIQLDNSSPGGATQDRCPEVSYNLVHASLS